MWPPAPWRNSRSRPLPPSATSMRVPEGLSVMNFDFIGTSGNVARCRSFGGELQRYALMHRVDPETVVVIVPVGPQVAQMRHDFLGEEPGGVPHLVVRHVAD